MKIALSKVAVNDYGNINDIRNLARARYMEALKARKGFKVTKHVVSSSSDEIKDPNSRHGSTKGKSACKLPLPNPGYLPPDTDTNTSGITYFRVEYYLGPVTWSTKEEYNRLLAVAMKEHKRRELVSDGSLYRRRDWIGPEKELKTCIWRGGDPISWEVLSTGFSWIGVTGTDTTCVVLFDTPICKRPANMNQIGTRNALLAGIAEMIATIGESSVSFHHHIRDIFHAGPLAVVSVAPCAPDVEEFQEPSRAINFLMDALKYRPRLSSREIEQIALCALKYLLGPRFKPDNIKVYCWGQWYDCDKLTLSARRVLRDDRNGFITCGSEHVQNLYSIYALKTAMERMVGPVEPPPDD